MSRYKKVVLNQIELKEIGGIKAIIKPSIEDKFKALEIFKNAQLKKDMDLSTMRDHLTDVLFKSLHEFDKDNKPLNKRIAGEEDTTKKDIDAYVVNNLFELWLEYTMAMDIISREKAKEMKIKMEEESKKKSEE